MAQSEKLENLWLGNKMAREVDVNFLQHPKRVMAVPGLDPGISPGNPRRSEPRVWHAKPRLAPFTWMDGSSPSMTARPGHGVDSWDRAPPSCGRAGLKSDPTQRRASYRPQTGTICPRAAARASTRKRICDFMIIPDRPGNAWVSMHAFPGRCRSLQKAPVQAGTA